MPFFFIINENNFVANYVCITKTTIIIVNNKYNIIIMLVMLFKNR